MTMVPTQQVAQTLSAGISSQNITIAQAATLCSLTLKFGITNVGGITINTITQTNVTWTRQQQLVGTTQIIEEWLGVPTGVPGTTIALALTGTTTPTSFTIVSEWPCIMVKDTGNSNNGISANPATGTITPISGRSILISAQVKTTGTFSTGPTNGFSNDIGSGSGNYRGAYLSVDGSTGTYSTDWTWTGSVTWDTLFVVYKLGAIFEKQSASNIGTKLGTRQPWMR